MLAIADIVRHLRLPFGNGNTPLDTAVRDGRLDDLLNEAKRRIGDDANGAGSGLSALYVLAHAFAKKSEPLDPHVVRAAARWLESEPVKKDARVHMLFGAAVADEHPQHLEAVLDDLLSSGRDITGLLFPLCGYLAETARARLLVALASHESDSTREHLFALLGKHQRLVPPGSVRLDFVPEDLMLQLLSLGITDRQARVRERAIAAAYGLGLVQRLRELITASTRDDDPNVRQYALVALGAMDDPDSHAVLLDRLRRGTDAEVTSAIWALARRDDGVVEVLNLAGDSRAWVNDEILGAFAEVSASVSDEQIAELDRRLSNPDFARFRERHIDRTRRGAPERGPDARINIVRRR